MKIGSELYKQYMDDATKERTVEETDLFECAQRWLDHPSVEAAYDERMQRYADDWAALCGQVVR